jgi:hypothetical protein
VRMVNELALSCMRDAGQSAQLDQAYAYLKWALKAPHATPALRAVTLNNAGIYYARTGNPAAALRCLERVGSQGGAVVEDDVSVHVTLNMTTVLADLGRHGEALEKAQEAVRSLTRAERAGRPVDASLLSAAYHNLAVQQERVGNARGHVRSYRAAVLQARRGGGKSQSMASFMEQAYSHARTRANKSPPLLRTGASAPGVRGPSGRPALPPISHASQPRSKPRGAASKGSLVSVDDVYSGALPNSPPPVPAIGAQHAPRGAGSATITSGAVPAAVSEAPATASVPAAAAAAQPAPAEPVADEVADAPDSAAAPQGVADHGTEAADTVEAPASEAAEATPATDASVPVIAVADEAVEQVVDEEGAESADAVAP